MQHPLRTRESLLIATDVVNQLLVQRFGVAASRVEDGAPLGSLGLDSLALEELRLLIEDRLDIDLDAVELTPRDTVGRLVTVVGREVVT
ncbi:MULTISPECIES: acyl carrier protein [Streptomyces]|nr:acyl carrier protein [Streptomyces harbinensis]